MHRLWILFFLLTGFFAACSDSPEETQAKPRGEAPVSHGEHYNLADDFAHRDIIVLESPHAVPDPVRRQFREVLGGYLDLENAMFDGDTNGIDRAAGKMEQAVAGISPGAFDGDSRKAWEQHAALYGKTLKELKHIQGLERKRSYFSHLSEILYCTVKSFAFTDRPLYVAYCPMALDEKGAYWLTTSETIRNPYFGPKMEKCGEFRETL